MTETVNDKQADEQIVQTVIDTCKAEENSENNNPENDIPYEGGTDTTNCPNKSQAHLKDGSISTDRRPLGTSFQSPANNQSSLQPQKPNLEQQLSKAKRDLESMVLKYARSEAENLQNKARSEDLDRKLKRTVKDNESLANRIKILTNDKNQLSDTLSAKVAQLTVLEQKSCSLSNVQDGKLKELENELEQLRKTNDDLVKSIETYKSKENELLDFSERLSMKQLLLQSELDKALEDAPDHKKRYDELVKDNANLREEREELTNQLRLVSESLSQERQLVEKLRSNQSELELKSRRHVEELENEIKVVKRKHQIATRELLKQLKCLQVSLDRRNDTHDSDNKVTNQV